jgi:hypothetical protein
MVPLIAGFISSIHEQPLDSIQLTMLARVVEKGQSGASADTAPGW